jgi:hypothetical protein
MPLDRKFQESEVGDQKLYQKTVYRSSICLHGTIVCHCVGDRTGIGTYLFKLTIGPQCVKVYKICDTCCMLPRV